jgi:hypothetical protein
MLRYSHPRDNLLRTASSITLTVGSVVSSEYSTARLFDGNPASPLILTGTSMDLDMIWGSPVLPEFVSIIHSNFTVAARLQGDNTDLSTPDIDVPFAIPTVSGQKWFSSPFLDMRGYTAKSRWRLRVVTNGYPVTLGELFFGSTMRVFTEDVDYLLDDAEFIATHGSIVYSTNYGVELAYRQQPLQQVINGNVRVSHADVAKVLNWFEAAYGKARPFVIVPFEGVNDAWMVRFATDSLQQRPLGNGIYQIPLPIRQLSRGLQWIDPDA